jgi:hypothetical protein
LQKEGKIGIKLESFVDASTKVRVLPLKGQLEETRRKNTIYENKYGVGVSKLSKTFVEGIQIMDPVTEQK